MFCQRYGVFSIDLLGFNRSVHCGPDRVAELSAGYHIRITRQAIIKRRYLTFVGYFDIVTDRLTEWEYKVAAATQGMSRDRADKFFKAQQEAWKVKELGGSIEEMNQALINAMK